MHSAYTKTRRRQITTAFFGFDAHMIALHTQHVGQQLSGRHSFLHNKRQRQLNVRNLAAVEEHSQNIHPVLYSTAVAFFLVFP